MPKIQPFTKVAKEDVSTHTLVTSIEEVYERAKSYLQEYVEREGKPGFKLATGTIYRNKVSVALHPIGASALAILVEELARVGVRAIINLDSAFALSPSIGIGSIIIAPGAIRADSISRAYEPCEVPAIPDYELMRHIQNSLETYGIEPINAIVWTTDIYYLGEQFIEQHIRLYGKLAQAVDMTTATLYTLSMIKKLNSVSILIVDSSFPKGVERTSWLNGEELEEETSRELRKKVLDVIDDLVKPLLEAIALHVERMKSKAELRRL